MNGKQHLQLTHLAHLLKSNPNEGLFWASTNKKRCEWVISWLKTNHPDLEYSYEIKNGNIKFN